MRAMWLRPSRMTAMTSWTKMRKMGTAELIITYLLTVTIMLGMAERSMGG